MKSPSFDKPNIVYMCLFLAFNREHYSSMLLLDESYFDGKSKSVKEIVDNMYEQRILSSDLGQSRKER